MKKIVMVLLVTVFSRGVFADSIDDAEAKQRGVPVEVILLEKQLADQRRQNTDLLKQIAITQTQVDQLKAQLAAGGGNAPASFDPLLPKLAEGPRESSPAYDGVIAAYMSGDWSNHAGENAKSGAQAAKLPAGNASDIAYVKAAVAECKPAWWQKAKTGSPQTIEASVFNHTIPVSFTDGKVVSNGGTRQGKVIVLASWPAQEMDTLGAIDAKAAAYLPAGNFTQGDWVDNEIWNAVSQHLPLVQYGELKLAELERGDEENLGHFQELIGSAAAMYYGTPSARYLELRRTAEFYQPKASQFHGISLAPIAGEQYLVAFVAGEMVSHPERYPSLKLAITSLPAALPAHMSPEQYILDNFVSKSLQARKLTFAEDCALRQAVWEFMMGNTDWTADQIKLPGGKVRSFDEKAEQQAAQERWNGFRQMTGAKPAGSPIPPPANP